MSTAKGCRQIVQGLEYPGFRGFAAGSKPLHRFPTRAALPDKCLLNLVNPRQQRLLSLKPTCIRIPSIIVNTLKSAPISVRFSAFLVLLSRYVIGGQEIITSARME